MKREQNDRREMPASPQQQKINDFEIIIVVAKAKRLFSKLQEYLSHIEYCRGDIIAFADDAILFEDWTENSTKAYEKHPKAIGVTGQAISFALGVSTEEHAKHTFSYLKEMLGSEDFQGSASIDKQL